MSLTRSSLVRLIPIGLCMAAFGLPLASATEPEHGHKLFLTGDAGDLAAKATVGAGNVMVPASSVPCASCHGRDGRGRKEGGVAAPDITQDSLMRPVQGDGMERRSRPTYTESMLIRAITMGIDAGGNKLDPVMPRFALSLEDASDLAAYLQRLGSTPEPGVDNGSLVIGTVLRPGGSAIGSVLAAYFDEINRRGGLFGRRVVLRVTELHDGEAFAASMARLAVADTVFALLAPMIAGEETAAVAEVDADGVPTIGPLALRVHAAPRSRYVFYINGGLEAEGSALAGFASSTIGSPEIVDDGTPVWRAVAQAAVMALADGGPLLKPTQPGSPELERALAIGAPVVWLAEGARAAVATLSGKSPTLLLPSTLAGDLLTKGAPVPTFVAFATGPADLTPAAVSELRYLTKREDVSPGVRAARRQALAAAKILVEALERAGRSVTRERLIDALERLQNFRTGLMPPVSFSPTRHIGNDGVWIVPLAGGAPIWWDK
jgi:ABC-type branched-subunit amino acid transport system substrate-binding protein/mono/diheme cytochrome c family protein